MKHKDFFSAEEKKALVAAIGEAEKLTSGEIRVHIEPNSKHENVLHRATEVFYKLKMDKTTHHNGVLIYIAHDDRKFAVLGDKGINAVVPANFWDETKEEMREHFKRNEFYGGVLFAIQQTGEHLKQYFPQSPGHKNELPDEISEG